jgi:thioredoxin-dependent peroxiredoxin
MIDPPKATKGRRMSKKTRKKSPKTPARKAARAQPAKSAKKPAAKAPRTAASKTGKNARNKKPGNVTAAASHTVPPKKLKSSSPTESAADSAARNASKPTAAKPGAAIPPAKKPSGGKADTAVVGKTALAEGAKAPAFGLPRDGGGTASLADYPGKKLVLFFYPRADTPGCTREAIDFTRLSTAFAESQTAVLGVSADPPKAQEAFRDKHQLGVPLVSDEKHEMLHAYGVWGEKSMYGRTFQGIVRTTVLIGANGRIARIWRHVKVDGHADEVLAAARSL